MFGDLVRGLVCFGWLVFELTAGYGWFVCCLGGVVCCEFEVGVLVCYVLLVCLFCVCGFGFYLI